MLGGSDSNTHTQDCLQHCRLCPQPASQEFMSEGADGYSSLFRTWSLKSQCHFCHTHSLVEQALPHPLGRGMESEGLFSVTGWWRKGSQRWMIT